jgi:hypothetical protein
MRGWIGVDLDGTLAKYGGWKGPGHIGEPVPAMVARVKKWISEGRDVRILTARVSHNGARERINEAAVAAQAISDWTAKIFGYPLPVTNEKDYAMIELWDDRCVQVEPNTGRRIDGRPD